MTFEATSGLSVTFREAGLDAPSGREGSVPKSSTPVLSLRPVPTLRLDLAVSFPKLSGSTVGLARNTSGTFGFLGTDPAEGKPFIRASLPA